MIARGGSNLNEWPGYQRQTRSNGRKKPRNIFPKYNKSCNKLTHDKMKLLMSYRKLISTMSMFNISSRSPKGVIVRNFIEQ